MTTRNTLQKRIVQEFLMKRRDHPTAEDLYKEISKEYPSITLATIYRNLHALAKEGKVLVFKVGNQYHFDGYTHHHLHFFCEKCKKIYDIEESKEIESMIAYLTNNGFKVTSYSVIFNGICNKCMKGDKNGRK